MLMNRRLLNQNSTDDMDENNQNLKYTVISPRSLFDQTSMLMLFSLNLRQVTFFGGVGGKCHIIDCKGKKNCRNSRKIGKIFGCY